MFQFAEDPRIQHRTAANGNRGTTGVMKHADGIIDRSDISIGNNRHSTNRIHDISNRITIHLSVKPLRPSSSVNRDGDDSDVFHGCGNGRGGQSGRVPAEPHLDTHGESNGFHNFFCHLHGTAGVAHQAGTATGSVDFRHGASHVQINCFVASIFEPFGRSNDIRSASTEELHCQRPVFRSCRHKLQ